MSEDKVDAESIKRSNEVVDRARREAKAIHVSEIGSYPSGKPVESTNQAGGKVFEESPVNVLGQKRWKLGDVVKLKPKYFGEKEVTRQEVEKLFSFHDWDEEQRNAGVLVREALGNAYFSILENVPVSPTRTRALNMITDARMLANQAITFKGEV